MRTPERTLLASMGFSDPDKGGERHDWACQYVCDVEERVAWSVVEKLIPKATEWRDTSNVHEQYREVRIASTYSRPLSEQIVTASERSAKPIAFVDVLIPFTADWQVEYLRPDPFEGEESCRGKTRHEAGQVLAEIKIRPVALGQVIRQLKTYLSLTGAYFYNERWMVGTTRVIPVLISGYDISVEDARALEREGIRHLRLGQSFDDYAERRRTIAAADSETI